MLGRFSRGAGTISANGVMIPGPGKESNANLNSVTDDNPNSLLAKETMSQRHHAEFNIAKEREYEKIQQRLYEEFSVLDKNHDGMITLDEIVDFFHIKVILFLSI